MTINSKPCASCIHFHQRYKIVQGKQVPVWYGWCLAKSLCSPVEAMGQVLPENAIIAENQESVKIKVVTPQGIETHCLEYMGDPAYVSPVPVKRLVRRLPRR